MNVNNIGRVLISLIVVIGFMMALYFFLTAKAAGVPPGETLSIMVGALASNFTSVVAYWIGSSSGSTAKDEQQQKVAEKLAEKVTAPVTSTAAVTAAAEAAAPAAAAEAAPPAAAVAAPPAVEAEMDRRGIPDKPKGDG